MRDQVIEFKDKGNIRHREDNWKRSSIAKSKYWIVYDAEVQIEILDFAIINVGTFVSESMNDNSRQACIISTRIQNVQEKNEHEHGCEPNHRPEDLL